MLLAQGVHGLGSDKAEAPALLVNIAYSAETLSLFRCRSYLVQPPAVWSIHPLLSDLLWQIRPRYYVFSGVYNPTLGPPRGELPRRRV